MAKNLKEALELNRLATEELDKALRECLNGMKDQTKIVAEGRLRVVTGGRKS